MRLFVEEKVISFKGKIMNENASKCRWIIIILIMVSKEKSAIGMCTDPIEL